MTEDLRYILGNIQWVTLDVKVYSLRQELEINIFRVELGGWYYWSDFFTIERNPVVLDFLVSYEGSRKLKWGLCSLERPHKGNILL